MADQGTAQCTAKAALGSFEAKAHFRRATIIRPQRQVLRPGLFRRCALLGLRHYDGCKFILPEPRAGRNCKTDTSATVNQATTRSSPPDRPPGALRRAPR